jgi:hypothetical protein
MAKTSPK